MVLLVLSGGMPDPLAPSMVRRLFGAEVDGAEDTLDWLASVCPLDSRAKGT